MFSQFDVFSANAFTVLILSPILGNLADQYGRRLVLATAIFGMMTGMAWVYMICRCFA